MSGHTPEPWHTGWLQSYDGMTGEPLAFIYRRDPDDPRETADNRIYIRGGDDPVADADRIVACVNALEGVEDPSAALKDARQALRLALPYVQNSYECASVEMAIISALLKLGGAR